MRIMKIVDKHLVPEIASMPIPRPGELRIRVRAAAVNRADLMQTDGNYPPPPDWPEWPGLECAGTVDAVEPGSKYKVGDEVCALLGGGGYAEYCTVPESMVLPVPKGLSMSEASGIPEVFSTVLLNFIHEAHIREGETVYVQAGASGLGIAAIQVAKYYHCKVITTVGTDEKAQFVRSLGADIAVNRKTGDIGAVLDANPPDIVLDCVGGPGMGANFVRMAPWGRWIQVAALAGSETVIPLDVVFRKRIRLIGSTLRSRTNELKSEILSEVSGILGKEFEAGRIRSVIHAVFPLEEANEAHAVLRRNENTGKVILTVS